MTAVEEWYQEYDGPRLLDEWWTRSVDGRYRAEVYRGKARGSWVARVWDTSDLANYVRHTGFPSREDAMQYAEYTISNMAEAAAIW